MAAINSVITSALDRAIDGIFDLSTISRYFTTFDPTPQTYISLSSPITLASDFEVEAKIATTGTAIGVILGNSGSTAYYLRVNADGKVAFKSANDGANAITTTSAYNDGKFHTVIAKRVGTELELFIDDVSMGTSTVFVINDVYDEIGNYSADNYFNGVISDVKIWDGGDRDTGTLVLDMPIDGSGYGTDTLVDNNQTVLGSELWISGEQTLLTGTQTSALNLGGQTPVYIQLPSDIEVTENGSWIGLGSTSVVITTQYVTFRNNSGSTIVFTPSVKEIPAATPLGTAENFADSYSEEFTFQDNGDWLAGEVVVNGGFDSDTNWTKTNTTISAGTLNFGGGTTWADQPNTLMSGNAYKLTAFVSDYSGGNCGFSSSSFSAGLFGTSQGEISGIRTAVDTFTRCVSDTSGNKLDNVSVKRILEAP